MGNPIRLAVLGVVCGLSLAACDKGQGKGVQDLTPPPDLVGGGGDLLSTGGDLSSVGDGAAPDQAPADDLLQLDLVPDTTAPTVTAISPTLDQSAVPTSSTIVVTFSESLAPGSVSTSSFHLSAGIVAAVTYDDVNHQVTITPSAALPAGMPIVVTVDATVTDAAGNALAAPYRSHFRTAPVAEVRADSGGAADVQSADHAYDGNGSAVAAYVRHRLDSADAMPTSLHVALFDATASTWSAEPSLYLDGLNNQARVKVVDGGDRLMVLLQEGPQPAFQYTAIVYRCVVGGAGCTWQKSSTVINDASLAQSSTYVGAVGRSGRFVVAWRTNDGKVLARIYEQGAWASTVELGTNAAERTPSVGANAEVLGVAWADTSDNLKVATYRTTSFVAQTTANVVGSEPRLTAAIGSTTDLWFTYRAMGSNSAKQVFARRHYINGSNAEAWDSATELSSGTVAASDYGVTSRPNGGLAVAWQEYTTTSLIKARRYQASAWTAAEIVGTLDPGHLNLDFELTPAGQHLAIAMSDLYDGTLYAAQFNNGNTTWKLTTTTLQPAGTTPVSGDAPLVQLKGATATFYLMRAEHGGAVEKISLHTGDPGTGDWTTTTMVSSGFSANAWSMVRDATAVRTLYEKDGFLESRTTPSGAGAVLPQATPYEHESGILGGGLLTLGDGTSAVIYQQTQGQSGVVRARVFDRGTPIGSVLDVTSAVGGLPSYRAVAVGGGYLVVYLERRDNRMYSRFVSKAGVLGDVTEVGSWTAGYSFEIVASGGKAYLLSADPTLFHIVRWDGAWTDLGTINPTTLPRLASHSGGARVAYAVGKKVYVVQPSGDTLSSPVEIGDTNYYPDVVADDAHYYYQWLNAQSTGCILRIEGSSLGDPIDAEKTGFGDCGRMVPAGTGALRYWSHADNSLYAQHSDSATWSATTPLNLTAYWGSATRQSGVDYFVNYESLGTDRWAIRFNQLSGATFAPIETLVTSMPTEDCDGEVVSGGGQVLATAEFHSSSKSTDFYERRIIDGYSIAKTQLATHPTFRGWISAIWDGAGFNQLAWYLPAAGEPVRGLFSTGRR